MNKIKIITSVRCQMSNVKCREGSALLIALIVMSVLLTLSLGVSSLVIDTLRDSRQLLEKTKAWYAAESGLEHALLDISQNPPGYETEKKSELGAQAATYNYKIQATTSKFPVKEPYEIRSEEDTYAALHLNESVTIPLFRSTKKVATLRRGSDELASLRLGLAEDSAKHFRVDYYVAPDIKLRGGHIDDDLDILRWKIFGISADGSMEVINEFLPANRGNSAASPTCIGTASRCYNAAKYYERRLAPDGFNEFHIVEKFPIETFLNQHTQNFLVLTNIMNIDLVAGALSSRDKKKIAIIRYRVVEEDGEPRLTLPSIKIAADGFAGKTKQSLNLEVKRESFLPVFNFALYRTVE